MMIHVLTEVHQDEILHKYFYYNENENNCKIIIFNSKVL
jgi:hypothetical protein